MQRTTLEPAEALRVLARLPLAESFSLAPAAYLSPGVYDLEKTRIFAREWLCAGRERDLARPGDYLTLDVDGLASLMVVRQKDGSLRALSRVCRHRAALLGEDAGGSAGLFVCPYHKWTYELDGSLRGAPGSDQAPGFDKAACALPAYPVEVWQGFVFVSLDPAAAPLAPRLASLDARLAPYRPAEATDLGVIEEVWPTNWKVAMENGSESYHHIGVHGVTLEPYFPGLGTACEPGTAAYTLHVVPVAPERGAAAAEDGIGERGLLIVGIYPNLVLALTPEHLTWFAFRPLGHDRTPVVVGMSAVAELPAGAREAAAEGFRATIQAILDEDRRSCAGVQRGLSMADAASGRLMPIERPIAEFVRYLDTRLNGGA
jgi:phenylpropionate dioxygenase-like ring-hydroxylating dioxygenase large terminal subunit